MSPKQKLESEFIYRKATSQLQNFKKIISLHFTYNYYF